MTSHQQHEKSSIIADNSQSLQKSKNDEKLTQRAKKKRLRALSRGIDLCGQWLGDFGDNGFEVVEIVEFEDKFVAMKITGDRNVPAEQISFYVQSPVVIGKNIQGKIQVAEVGFHKPRFVDFTKFVVSDPNTFSFRWSTAERVFKRMEYVGE